MRINCVILAILFVCAMAQPSFAAEGGHAAMEEHGENTYHMFRLEMDAGRNTDGASIQHWDLDGWVGTDNDKLWLKSEGERVSGSLESTEFWALYSRNIATFWDAQAGIRYDTEPDSTAYLTFGVNGLAPYWFETEAHLFISEHGDVTARIRQENDLLLTQKLILQPYLEVNLSAQDVPEQDIGTGITDGAVGLQTRYEFTRKFAPYIDLHYGRKIGETSSIAKSQGEDNEEVVAAVGLRLMF